ncbi:MAG: hypothetical protein A2271_04450 [Candidatus Moranbacteria bacterium RIFOXYA12_FULL_35_19]|nr:MAG: hypothetical protein UR78_C0001G0019 [Candidatus Moranbacteria bacterium GW2011_GWF2_35_39]OGI31752.1 MAG: hypothetical protein A2343_04460 [Candidatus Moranbacteria bacterium RIFOXYB12_FULL_35_8]OGI35692.1 MAG: hypothetical protein A2271_04450 [Candidatus Moranbacteria bacterium RIFOXYA12_FULL_35_19]
MDNKKNILKLCFHCDRSILENGRISISSITHAGLKDNILKRHREKMKAITNYDDYEPYLMHLRCYDDIASGLGFGDGEY